MSVFGSQNDVNMVRMVDSKPDLSGGETQSYGWVSAAHGVGNGQESFKDRHTYTITRSFKGGEAGGMSAYNHSNIHQWALMLQVQCQDYLKKAENALQSGNAGDAEQYMMMAKEPIEQLKSFALDLKQQGQPNDNVVKTLEMCRFQLNGVHQFMTGTIHRRRSAKGSGGAREEPLRSFQDAMGWIAQQKRLIATASWGDNPAAIEQQLVTHQRFCNSIQRSAEMVQARDELHKKGDKACLRALEQEWESLQKMLYSRTQQLEELQQVIQEMSKEIMWVNDREEEELMFDWGDKNIDQYIPRKQESYSRLMSTLELKEKDLNKLKAKVDAMLKSNHPASDKIEAYRDTLQTQWSWLLQITKCIDIHLKENAAYNQFFKEANDTYSSLQKEHEMVCKKFTCDKNTTMEDLLELLRALEREKERIQENKRQVQHLVAKSKEIVRLKPRNPEEKSSSPIIIKALCDFRQDQKRICKGDEAILKNNSQRSKWEVTGPGGLDMSVPSVCLIVPPPNPLGVSLANKNEQYYEAILSIWNQLYINVKSLIAWQYCLLDIRRINSLTITMLAKMRPEEYRQIIKSLETHFEEFKVNCQGSQMFVDEDKRVVEKQINGAQTHYDKLVVQLPAYIANQEKVEEAPRLEDKGEQSESKNQGKKTIENVVIKMPKTVPPRKKVVCTSLSELHSLRLRLEGVESALSQHVHICLGDDAVHNCGLKITQLELVQHDIDSVREEYLRLRERISKELEDVNDPDKAQFLRSEITIINQRLASLGSSSLAYLQRLRALRALLESVARAEDIVKVHEARLTEKETTSLSPSEVEDYILTLTNIKAELDQKKYILASIEAELAKMSHWDSQVGGAFQTCDMMLSKYAEQVGLLGDRWRRINGQIDTRLQDLQLYLPQLQHYEQSSASLFDWIEDMRKKQVSLQATKIDSIQALKDHINNQKALNSEITSKRQMVDSVLKDNVACVNSVKDYETDLAAYTSGLETLLNIPIKRTMLRSPSVDLNQEATQLQIRYMELLTMSGDYYRFLADLLKNMEEVKIRDTRIDLLEEELRLLRENIQDSNAKNKSLEDALTRYKLDLSQMKDQLLSVETVKESTMMKYSAIKDSQDNTQSELGDLKNQVAHLNYLLEEEKRKRILAEEHYSQRQEECDSILRKRQKELETVSWAKMEIEKTIANKDHEIELLRRQLAEEASQIKELQMEISKVRSQSSMEINNLKLSYESQVHISRADIQRLATQREEDATEFQVQHDRMAAERGNLEEELRKLRMINSELEEETKKSEKEVHSQCAIIMEEGHRKRELEHQLEILMRQRDEERTLYRDELADVMKILKEKNEELLYTLHNLEEETRRRKTVEERQDVLEKSVAQLQVKLTGTSIAATQLEECKVELQKMHLELKRETSEKTRVEQNLRLLQGRMKDLQAVRDGLENQVENLRKANQEEGSKRRQLETEQEKTKLIFNEYANTILILRQNQDQSSMSEKKGEEERLRLKEELERSLRQNTTSEESMTQLRTELKALQQQLLHEQARVKEATLKNEGLQRSIEERSSEVKESTCEIQRLKQLKETQTKERLRLEEELMAAQHDAELLMSRQGDALSSQISTLQLQLQASERSNVDYRNLISELTSEREKLKLETEKIQKQTTEITTMLQSLQSQHNAIVAERDSLLLKLQFMGKDKDHIQKLDEELRHIKLTLESELRNKQHLMEENQRLKSDVGYWKEQFGSKEGVIKQYDTDLEKLEREKNTMKSEIERLMRELRELEESYKSRLAAIQKELQEVIIVRQNMEVELKRAKEAPILHASTLIFDGVRKSVTANQLLDCGVLDKATFNQLVIGHKTVPEVSGDKKINLKGTGPIAGVIINSPKSLMSVGGPLYIMTFTEAKKENLLPPDSIDLLLDAQAATGHIIDPRTNQKLTVEEACIQGLVDEEDKDRLLAAEAAAVGYSCPGISKPLSVFQAMKKGLIDRNTTLRVLQAQESVGGILDPVLSVYLPKETAIDRCLIDDDLCHALNKKPELYLDPESEEGVTYMSMKRRCKVEPRTGLLLLPILEKADPSKLLFDGVRKPVTAKQLLDYGVLDKPTYKDLENGETTVPNVSVNKHVHLKGTGPIAGVIAGSLGKMSLSDAKKRNLLPELCADLLLEAQAATGHIIDPRTNQKLTVDEACARGVVDIEDQDRLLAAEAAAVGYKHYNSAKPLSVFEAMKQGLIDRKTGLRLLQAQESVGGILDPSLSVFLPKDKAINFNLLDEDVCQALNQSPKCYFDPETEQGVSYGALKKRCKSEPHTGLLLLPVTERLDPSKLIFDGVRKPVTAQQLLDCGILDKQTFNQLLKGEKTVPEVSVNKNNFLKGTGSIAGVAAGPLGKMALSEAKKKMFMLPESADLLLDAQAATGYIIDPTNNEKLTVEEACARGMVDNRDRDRLLEAEAAAVGYRDPITAKPLAVFEAMKKGLIDRKTALRLLQAQESVGGILDPNLSVFLPRDKAKERNLIDEDLSHALNKVPEYYLDPDTELDTSYSTLKKKCKFEPHTGLILLPITERKDPSKLMFAGVRKPVSAKQLFECGVLDKPTFDQLVKGEKTVQAVSMEKIVYLKGTGPIAGVIVGRHGKMSLSEAKKQKFVHEDSADFLLEAQAATGYIIDPSTNQKLTVEEACSRGLVDIGDRGRLLAAEAAVVGYSHHSSGKLLSVFEAMKKGIIDKETSLRLLQAQESVGGILDPNLSVFLPKDTAIKHNLLDEDLSHALKQNPISYLDPETKHNVSYGTLKERCVTELNTGLQLLPVTEKADPSNILFDGVRKTVTAQQLLDCGVLDKLTFDQLIKGEKTVSEVSVDKKVFLKGTGSIAGVAAGPFGKMSFTEAKNQKIISSESADMLLNAQAATGYIIDPKTSRKLTVKEACTRGVVDMEDEKMLFAAEAAVIGYRDPDSASLLSVGQAMKKGLINKDTAVRRLQAQQAVGGILDPVLSVFLPTDIAMNRGLIDEDLYQELIQYPECYVDPYTQQGTTYVSLKRKCKIEPSTGLLLLPEPQKPLTVAGLRGQVSVIDLVDANLLEYSDIDQLNRGRLTKQDIENRLQTYLRGSTCIAGIYDEANDEIMPIYQAMKDGLLQPETALELLEAQAASGFIVDPVSNLYLTVTDAYNKNLFGPEFKENLLAAEKAVTGYKMPGTDKTISLSQAIERGLVDKGHGSRLLEAQIASGGIIDPDRGHRLDMNVAYMRGYFDEKMNNLLKEQSIDTKGFFDPNTEENLTYSELKKRCITDEKTGLILLPIVEEAKKESIMKNTLRKRRVVIVDPETKKEMTLREAYDKGYIDRNTFVELSQQECEWEEVTITDPDGFTRFIINDKKTGKQYDITDLLAKQVISQSVVDQYRSQSITLNEFADIITSRAKRRPFPASGISSVTPSLTSVTSVSTSTSSVRLSSTSGTTEVSVPFTVASTSSSSSVPSTPLSPVLTTSTVSERHARVNSTSQDSPDYNRNVSKVSIALASSVETPVEQEPVGAIFDTETLEKISITEALDRGLVDSITAQRLLEAQACTGGIINPINGQRIGIQEALHLGLITEDMASKLKPAQKAYFGFEDVKNKKKMSAAEAMKEMWLPYEAGQRFLEFQFVTGGLYDPEMSCRRTVQDALEMGWLDEKTAHKFQDTRHHTKNLTCPKSKLKFSYKDALDNCMVEEKTGVKMLQAASVSSMGISSPYNVSSAPGSTTGSRSSSRRGSRRNSLDLGSARSSSASHHSSSTFTTFLSTT